ncbi:hypothetical protein KZZ52_33490 [Dactylosporangium sp. AC04546]|uniref:hypothetical protein n=1 Tax=Dactylosporangium sp. AC04546 TaxID=2862460 RepID=UPI001EDE3561|nr:hypothetical protein [Dactylosporangium sp. AC04546]WVK78892.1 hypothetical protein KZZ52_33490 [Dactylosporangium sp. AC04546]
MATSTVTDRDDSALRVMGAELQRRHQLEVVAVLLGAGERFRALVSDLGSVPWVRSVAWGTCSFPLVWIFVPAGCVMVRETQGVRPSLAALIGCWVRAECS